MASISISGANCGFQIGQNSGHITAQLHLPTEQSEISANLACLRDLRTTNPRHDKCRIETEKGGLLKDAYTWILDQADFIRWRYQEHSQLLWIKGDPGKGKTMLLCGIINELMKSAPDIHTVSFFFCQATDVRINDATSVLRGLISMIVDQQPLLISHIRKQYDKAGKQVFEDVNAWEALSEILASILQDPLLRTSFIIIDALDECTSGLDRLLEFLAQKSSAYPHIKWIVSSRNWPTIEEALSTMPQNTKLCLELNETSVAQAVAIFIDYKVQKLAERKKYNNDNRDAVFQHLSSNAHGTFLWVALVCKELTHVSKRHVRKKLQEFPSGLSELYKRMLSQIRGLDDAELCKSLLEVMTTVYRPITLDELMSCIEIPEDVARDYPDNYESVEEIIRLCGSFLTIRERTISLVHHSAKDFLLQEAEVFSGGEGIVHYSIFSRSLGAMARTLRRDIYSLIHPGCPIEQVKKPDPDPLAAIQYACIYWADHLCRCSSNKYAIGDLQDSGPVNRFFRNDYLHWLEVLSLSRNLSGGVVSIRKLKNLLQMTPTNSQLIDRVRDAYRFILYHKMAIERYPLQAYASGLIFCPVSSITRMQFQEQRPAWIFQKTKMEEDWSACLQTLEGHTAGVNSVVFSHDSHLLASASADRTIKLWDISTGRCLQTFQGHSEIVNTATFSHDSRLVASASWDHAVKIWSVSSGQCLQTFLGHNDIVESAAFSHDSRLVASASSDRTIKVWDTNSSQCLQTLEGHSDTVSSAFFSYDSKLLVSASLDRYVKVWNTSSGECIQTLHGHSNLVHWAIFSHNSMLLASASYDRTIKVWDTDSGQCRQTLEGHNDMVSSIAFSDDSKLLVSSSWDRTIKLWDAASSQCIHTLRGHGEGVKSVVFSHESKLLASASWDHTIKVWDACSSGRRETLYCHSDPINSIVFSHDSKLLASSSWDCTTKIWDVSNGNCLQTLVGHSAMVSSAIFSHNSKHLASASDDRTIKVWDTSSGQCLHTLEGHRGGVTSVAFSWDSEILASSSWDRTIKLWNASSGDCLQTFKSYSHVTNSAMFSYDSKLLALASDDRTAQVWDISNGQCLQTFQGHSDVANLAIFSYDSKLIASASRDRTVKVWDVNSGLCLQTLEGHNDLVYSTVFSRQSKLLASSSRDRTIKVWDTANGQCLQTLDVEIASSVGLFDITNSYLRTSHGTIAFSLLTDEGLNNDMTPGASRYEGWSVSSDGTWITWNSENQLWLPPEYRPRGWFTSAVSPSTICIGCASGRILLFTFDSLRLSNIPAKRCNPVR